MSRETRSVAKIQRALAGLSYDETERVLEVVIAWEGGVRTKAKWVERVAQGLLNEYPRTP